MPFKWWCGANCFKKKQLEDIQCLDFSHQHLLDVPPDVFQFERTLEELDLHSNRITELPRQLFFCQELKVLLLNDNEISSIPAAIHSLNNLNKLNLSRNMLGTIHENVKALKSLRYLDLSLNALEKLPDAVTNLNSLLELYLNDTMMEFLPANFGRLINLRILELRENTLLTLPKSMARLHALQRLDIGQNEFTELPEVIGQLMNLTELWADSNRIRRMPSNIGLLKKLQHVDLNNNLLSTLNPEIGEWTKLEELSVSANELESIPSTIGNLRSLVSLKLDENQLQELPDSICHCEMLEELMLSHNDLFKLPSTIGLLRRLRILTVDENFLPELPNELSSCISLSILSVRGNKLTELPPDIGRLVNLSVINIVNNFVSHLPVSLLNLSNLAALWINDNQSQPLVPLQKDYSSNGNIKLTCYMLPQTVGGGPTVASKVTPSKERTDTVERRRICFAETLPEESGANDEDTGAATEQNELIYPKESPMAPAPDATMRLMRSPTPYPKDLRVLAKYVRHSNTSRSSRLSADVGESMEENNSTTQLPRANNMDHEEGESVGRVRTLDFYSESVDGNPTLQMPPSVAPPLMLSSEVKEANLVTSASIATPVYASRLPAIHTSDHRFTEINGNSHAGGPTYDAISYNYNHEDIEMDLIDGHTDDNVDDADDDYVVSLNKRNMEIPPPAMPQPPPYHIAKTYTKKTPEDLMIYDSFRMNQSHKANPIPLSTYDNVITNNGYTTSATPITTAAVNNYDDNRNLKTIDDNDFSSTPTATIDNVSAENLDSPSSPTSTTPNSITTSPSKKKDQSPSWIFGVHRNPRVLQYQIHNSGPTVGFQITHIAQEGIFISEVASGSIANLYLKQKDKILDIDGTDFTKMSLNSAQQFINENVLQNTAYTIMVSRK